MRKITRFKAGAAINRATATATAAKDILAIWRKRFDERTLMSEKGIQNKVKGLLETYASLGKSKRLFKMHGTGLCLQHKFFSDDAVFQLETRELLDQEIFSIFLKDDVDDKTGYGVTEKSSNFYLHGKMTPFQLLPSMVEDFQVIPGSISSYNTELALDCDNFDATAWLAGGGGETDDFEQDGEDPLEQQSHDGDLTFESDGLLGSAPTISSAPLSQEKNVTESADVSTQTTTLSCSCPFSTPLQCSRCFKLCY